MTGPADVTTLFVTLGVALVLLGLAIRACGRGDRIAKTSWLDMPLIPLNRAGRRRKR